MAASDTVFYKTNAGKVPAVVLTQYDSNGDALETAHHDYTSVDTVDVVLLGFANGQRLGVTLAANEGAALVNDAFIPATS